MALIDTILKWFKAPKTMKGIVGLIVIIIVLAVDFAYWAGAIDVSAIAGGSGDDSEGDQNWMTIVERALDEEDTITAPGFGQDIPDTYIDYYFQINDNATGAIINLTYVDGISGPASNPDLDLYVFAPDGEPIGDSASESADESVSLSANTLRNRGPGEYQAQVKAFRGFQITYQITADVSYNVTIDAENP